MHAESRLTPSTEAVLRLGGWRSTGASDEEVDAWVKSAGAGFPVFDEARRALRHFGGVRVDQSGPGAEVARETFELKPSLALGEHDRFGEFASRLESPLFPLGEAGNGHVFLAIAPDGRVYALMEEIWLLGQTIEDAIECLVQGRRSTKMF